MEMHATPLGESRYNSRYSLVRLVKVVCVMEGRGWMGFLGIVVVYV